MLEMFNYKHKCTPTEEELLPNYSITCTQPDCNSCFTNRSNYGMHLQRHHKIAPNQTKFETIYHCPVNDCLYNVNKEMGKSFKNLKYLRQHYQKVHMQKSHQCEFCGKSFIIAEALLKHQSTDCGRIFSCPVCNWEYDNKEALAKHVKRKGHVLIHEQSGKNCNKFQLPRIVSKRKIQEQVCCQETQTEEAKRICVVSVKIDEKLNAVEEINSILRDMETQTELPKQIEQSSNDFDDIDSLLRDIETQTELTHRSTSTTTDQTSNLDFIEQIWTQSSMHTQTCDDFLTALGLADIQTQTNWSHQTDHQQQPQQDQYTSTDTTMDNATNCLKDDFLVSTETQTQTSFTQCLLDSSMATTSDAGTDTGDDIGAFGLYNTQYTQTCDISLNDLFDNDLISNFQSSYTQT